MKNRLRVVIDTNVLLVSISARSKYHWLYQGLLNADFEALISNDTLTEYEEIISSKFSTSVAKNVIRTLLLLPNVTKVDIFYNWALISNDADDNKFVDCAIASNADYIVTNDKHFNILRTVEFPKVDIVNINQFQNLLGNQP